MIEVIGKRVNITDCENCNSIIKFTWDEAFTERRAGYTCYLIKCPCCKKNITIVGTNQYFYRKVAELNEKGKNIMY